MKEIELKVSALDLKTIGWALEVAITALVAKSQTDEDHDEESSVQMIQRLSDVSDKISQQAEEAIEQ